LRLGVRVIVTYYKPREYSIYEYAKENYLQKFSTIQDEQDELLEELEDILHLTYQAYYALKLARKFVNNYHSLAFKSNLYATLLIDLKQFAVHISWCSSNNQEKLKEFCDKLLTLYGQTVIALEKLLYITLKHFKRIPFGRGLYSNYHSEVHFKSYIYKIITQDRLNIYFIDIACLFEQLRQKIAFFA
jgi:hypothetical protein